MDGLARRFWDARAGDEGNGIAYAEVDHVMRRGGGEAVKLLVELASAAPDEESLGSLGAGWFEDLVRWHGVPLAAELDAAMDREPKLRKAVTYVRLGVEQLESDVSFVHLFGVA